MEHLERRTSPPVTPPPPIAARSQDRVTLGPAPAGAEPALFNEMAAQPLPHPGRPRGVLLPGDRRDSRDSAGDGHEPPLQRAARDAPAAGPVRARSRLLEGRLTRRPPRATGGPTEGSSPRWAGPRPPPRPASRRSRSRRTARGTEHRPTPG